MRSDKDVVDWADPAAKRWMGSITRPGTQRYYKSAFRLFVEYTKKTPTELVDEALEDLRRDPKEKQDVVMQRVIGFYKWLKEDYGVKSRGSGKHVIVGRGVSDKVAGTYANVVRSFYDTFGISVKMKGRRALPKGRVTNKRVRVSADQVKQLVDNARTPRDKAIIITLFQSGMDVSTLCSLKYRDISKSLDGSEIPFTLELYRNKTGVESFTFLGKDAIDALRVYVKDLQAREVKPYPDMPLFLTEKNKEAIETHNVQNMLREVAVKAGFVSREEDGNPRFFNPYGPHALRESFGSIMINSGVPDTVVDLWLGHQIGEMDEAYKGVQFESVKRMYADREHLLSPFASLGNGALKKKIDEELDRNTKELREKLGYLVGKNMETDERIKILTAENERMRGGLQGVMAEVQELKRLIEAMQKRS